MRVTSNPDAGFKFAGSAGSGRVLFNQTVYNNSAPRCFCTSSLGHWYPIWSDQKAKSYNGHAVAFLIQ